MQELRAGVTKDSTGTDTCLEVRMRRLPVTAVVLATLLAAPLPYAAAHHKPDHKENGKGQEQNRGKEQDKDRPRVDCSRDSWLAGSVELCDGRVIYRDYLYDDYGADDPLVPAATRSTTGSLARPAGDARYPVGKESTADLVRLELNAVGDRLVVTAEMAALHAPADAVLAIALDTDGNDSTGGGAWPGLQKVTSRGWESVTLVRKGDPRSNLLTASLPLPRSRAFRVQAVTAQPDGTAMNVAFRGTDEQTVTGSWWEDRQSQALQSGDVSAFGHAVTVADLVARRSRPADQAAPGFSQRVYTSQHTLGEGMTYDGKPGRHGSTGSVCEQEFHFLGKYQPYGVYVPKAGQGPRGVQLALHGCNANHSSLVDLPSFQRQFGEDLNRVVVVPLGRGPVGYYSDISERDVLDVLADVDRTFAPDRAQVFAGGYSMGGYGAYRFAALYPQLFAGMVNWVGFTGDATNAPVAGKIGNAPSGSIGNVIDFVGNLRHVPSALLYSGADELVHVSSALAMERAYAGTDNVYEFFLHPYADHLTYAVVDDWAKESAWTKGRRLVRDPARVTYRTDPSLAYPEYGIRHDRAYWVSQIGGRGPGYVDVDLTTAGCGGSTPVLRRGNGAGVGPAAFAWVSTKQEVAELTPLPRSGALTGRLDNVSTATVDVAAACLSGPVVYDLTTDGPVTLRFSDGRVLRLAGGRATGVLR